MSDIPSDLQCEILKLLPMNHLVCLRPVCKEWRSIIDSFIVPATLLIRKGMPGRSRRKSKIYSLPLDYLDSSSDRTKNRNGIISLTSIKNGPGVPNVKELPLTTCDGLILIPSDRVKNDWSLWSPGDFSASSVHSIPPYDPFVLNENEPKFKMQDTNFFGLGYDVSTSDYKVVRVAQIFGPKNKNIDLNIFRTSIYSLKSQTWHRIEDFPRVNYEAYGYERAGVFMQGALHWIASVKGYGNPYCIVALDLSSENYRRLPLPSTISTISTINKMCLDVLGGHLFLSCDDDTHGKSVWILKDYGEENKWAQLASFKPERDDWWFETPMRPVAYLKSKEQVILHYDRDKLMWVDVEKQKFLKGVTIKGFEEHGFSCQQIPVRLASSLSGMCHAADGSVALDRMKVSKRKTVDIEFEISSCKRPKRWTS